MKTRIQKWGNSRAVRLPKSFADGLGLTEGSPAEITLEDGAIVVRPDRERVWDLETLVAGVTGENLHPAWETETAEGVEESWEDKGGKDGAG